MKKVIKPGVLIVHNQTHREKRLLFVTGIQNGQVTCDVLKRSDGKKTTLKLECLTSREEYKFLADAKDLLEDNNLRNTNADNVAAHIALGAAPVVAIR
jgi:hypothetical protein